MAVETSVFGIVLLLAFGLWIGLGLLAAHVANEKGRGGCAWFIVGMLFGPIAFLALIAIPARDQAAADSRASGTLPSAPGALRPRDRCQRNRHQVGLTIRGVNRDVHIQ